MGRFFTVRFRTKNVLGLNRVDWLEVLADDAKEAVTKARRLHFAADGDPSFELVEVIPDVAL